MVDRRHTAVGVTVALAAAGSAVAVAVALPLPAAPGCPVFPDDHVWHATVEDLPVHPMSDTWRDAIGDDAPVHPDFGSGTWNGGPIGIPYTVVDGDQPRVEVHFLYDDESDPGPYPIPSDAPIEGGPDAEGDRHMLVVDRDACVLHELFDAHPRDDGAWDAGSGAVYDLRGYDLRPETWTSADAAGLAILPGLVRFDEVAAGVIDHPIRFTAPATRDQFVWPARHQAGHDDPSLPPMGAWFRLRADTDLSGLGPQATVIARALQVHGMLLADNGSSWYLSGAPDPRWDDDDLRTLRTHLRGTDFEAVDTSSLVVDHDSARVAAAAPVREVERIAGDDRVATAVMLGKRAFPDGAPAAVVARADAHADALAATPLAGAAGGPVLLTGRDGLDPRVRAVLDELGVEHVWVMGGTAALSDAVVAGLPAGVEATRVAGADRYETAVRAAAEVAALAGTEATAAVVALGDHPDPSRAFPDALGAGVLAARTGAALLLVAPDRVPEATRGALAGLADVTVVGGPAAVSEAVAADLGADGRAVRRLAGPDRFATAAAVAVALPDPGGPTLVASGRDFPDALGAGAASLALHGRLLLTEPTLLPDATTAIVRDAGARPVVLVGGARAVTSTVEQRLASA